MSRSCIPEKPDQLCAEHTQQSCDCPHSIAACTAGPDQVRVQLTSLPPELDLANRKVLLLEVERVALAKEAPTDPLAARRLTVLDRV